MPRPRGSQRSSPIGVIEIVLAVANDPEIPIRSMSAFHSGHPATSDQSRQIASGEAAYRWSVLSSTRIALSLRRRAG
jgi:hypothetical protein